MATQPDITAPVSRTAAASLGTIMNYGTAVNSVAGGANVTVGGSADNGVATFQNTAKNAIILNKDTNLGGATKESLVSSQNPASIQLDSTNEKQSQYIARSADARISSVAGYHVDFPAATNVASQQPGARSGPAYVVEGNTYPNSVGKVGAGLQASMEYGSQNNLGNMQNDVSVANSDQVRAQRQGGKKAIGSPAPQIRNESEEGITSTNFITKSNGGAPAQSPVANGANAEFTDVQVG